MKPRILYLCTGLQSSGSTVISWCFLQRSDMDGVLDARNDVLPDVPQVGAPFTWLKMTLACFRTHEVEQYYRDDGWEVRPLLVVRDVRAVFNSLLTKRYGANGVTAEEPPLRLRLRRFKEDWLRFAECAQPMISYEHFVAAPEKACQSACGHLNIPYERAMLDWPKSAAQIAAAGHGNPTFRSTRGRALADSLRPDMATVSVDNIPPKDLEWMEREFASFNAAFGYADHIEPTREAPPGVDRAIPSWEQTRRYQKSKKPLTRLTNAWADLTHRIKPRPSRTVTRLRGD